jgi:hypothetical protein
MILSLVWELGGRNEVLVKDAMRLWIRSLMRDIEDPVARLRVWGIAEDGRRSAHMVNFCFGVMLPVDLGEHKLRKIQNCIFYLSSQARG